MYKINNTHGSNTLKRAAFLYWRRRLDDNYSQTKLTGSGTDVATVCSLRGSDWRVPTIPFYTHASLLCNQFKDCTDIYESRDSPIRDQKGPPNLPAPLHTSFRSGTIPRRHLILYSSNSVHWWNRGCDITVRIINWQQIPLSAFHRKKV